eukprot:XP_001691906.1 predicted protein [Chlamydomonas reinhardtii]
MQLMQHQQQYIQQLHQRQQLQQLQRQQHQEALMQGLSTSAFGAARRGARAAAANRASCAGSVASGGAAAGGTVAMARAGGVAAAVSAAHAGASARDIDVSVGGSVARRQSTCIGVGAAAYQHQQQAAAGAVASGMFGSRALHHSGVGGLPAGSLYATAAASIGGGGGGGGRRTRSVENLMLVSNGSDDFCSMESTAAAASARSKPLPPPQPGSHTVHFPMSRAAAAGAGGASADAPAASSRAAAWIPVGALSPTSGTAREALSMNGAGPASPRSSRGKNFLARSLARLTSLAKMGGGASGSTGPGAISGMGDGGTSSSNQQQRSGLHRSPALSDGQVMLSNELLSVMAGVTSVDQAKEASRTFGGNSVGAAAAAGAAAGTGLKVVAAAAAAAAGMALEPAHRHVSVSWNHLTRAASGPLGAATLEVPQQPPPELWTFTPPAAKNSGSSGNMPMSSPRTAASGLCDDALGVGSATGGLAGAPVAGRFMSSSNVINRSAFHTCGDVVILEAAAAAAGGEEDAAAVADLVADVSIRGGIHGSVGASPRAGASAGLSGSFGSALHGHAGSSAVLMPPVIASSAGILTTTASCNSNQHVMLQHQSGHSALGALSTTAAGLGRLERSSAATLMQQQDLQQHQQQAADGANSRSCSPQKDGRDAETQLLAGHSGSWRNSCRAGGGGGGGGMGEATGGQDSGAQQTGGTMRSFASTPEAVDHGSGGGGGGGGGTLAVSSYASAGAGAGAAAAAASGLLSAEMLTAGAAAGNGRGGGKMAGMLVVTSFSVDTAAGGGGAADATAAVGSVLGGGAGGLGTEGGSWYELTVSAVPHPTSPGEFLIMVVQHDVSARVWAERQLARVVEAEHALLEVRV